MHQARLEDQAVVVVVARRQKRGTIVHAYNRSFLVQSGCESPDEQDKAPEAVEAD